MMSWYPSFQSVQDSSLHAFKIWKFRTTLLRSNKLQTDNKFFSFLIHNYDSISFEMQSRSSPNFMLIIHA